MNVSDDSGRHVELATVLLRAALLVAQRRKVTVFAEDEMLTTQQAADQLNLSRQYLVRLVDRGDLPSIKVGSHRRVAANVVSAFKKARDADRHAPLDRLATLSESASGYALGHDDVSDRPLTIPKI